MTLVLPYRTEVRLTQYPAYHQGSERQAECWAERPNFGRTHRNAIQKKDAFQHSYSGASLGMILATISTMPAV